jgi:peptide/nickel transport system permease protein
MISAVLSPGPFSLILVLSFLGWTGEMRIMRGEAYKLREHEFVLAARSMGASDWRLMFFHIAPNALSLLLITLARSIGAIILAESSLSFLGFGIKPPIPSWGNMLSGGLDLLREAPHLVVAPGLLITVTVLCLYIIGDGLRDAFDPKTGDK